MRVDRLRLQNFLSHADSEIVLTDRGLTLLDGVNHDRGGTNGSGKCVHKSCRIMDLEKGDFVTIEDFVERRASATAGMVNGKVARVSVSGWHALGKKPTRWLTLKTGQKIRVAVTHPIQTPAGFVEAGFLVPGDWVAETRSLPRGTGLSVPTDDEAFFLGLFLGDGALTNSGLTFSKVEGRDNDVLQWVKSYVGARFQAELKSYDGGRNWQVQNQEADKHARHSGLENVRDFFKKWGVWGRTSRDKKIPDGFLSWPDSAISSLIGGLWTTDGYVQSAAKKREVSYSSGSKEMFDQVRWGLLRLGIVSTVRVRHVMGADYWDMGIPVSAYKPFHQSVRLLGVKKAKMQAHIDQVDAFGRDNFNIDCIPPHFCTYLMPKEGLDGQSIRSNTGFKRTRKQLRDHAMSRNTYLDFRGDPAVAEADYFWTKVVSVTDAGESDCYDITVDSEDHSYIAETVVVHNSSCINGLCWGLYGETLTDLPTDSISFQGQGNTSVEIDAVCRGVDVKIRRYLKHSQFKSNLIVTANGERVSGGTVKETQKRLDGLLGCTVHAFRWSCLFHPNEKGFAALTDKAQKEVLEAILHTDRFSDAQERAKALLGTLEQTQASTRARIDSAKAQVDSLTTSVRQLRVKSDSWSETRAKAAKLAEDALVTHRTKEPARAETLLSQIDTLRKEWAKVSTDLPAILQRQRALRDQVITARQDQSKFQTSWSHYSKQRQELHTIDPEAEVSSRSNCPACAQSLPPKAILALRQSFEDQARAVEERRGKLKKQADEAHKKAEISKEEAQAFDESLKQIDVQVKACERVQSDLTSLESKASLYQRAQENWKLADETLQAQLERVQHEPNPYLSLIRDQAEILTKTGIELKRYQEEVGDLVTRIKMSKFWVEGFGRQGVVSLLLDSVIPVLNERANYYLSLLTQDQASVTFQTQSTTAKGQVREKFTVQAAYEWGSASYQGTSDGERRRVDLAVMASLGDLLESRNGATIGIRILDEPFGPLDAPGHEQVIRLLKLISKRVGTVLVTSHEDSIKSLDFDSRITVTKNQGVSKVTNG